MATFFLIHGAWHGNWCWSKITPLLEQAGHKVVTPNLPGHGPDERHDIAVSLENYVDAMSEVLDRQKESVYLLGHSMSGIIISQLAEKYPEKIHHLVYLAAYILKKGQSILEVAERDIEGLVLPNLVFSRNKRHASIKAEKIREAFYADCTESDFQHSLANLVPQSLAPFSTPLEITEERWGRLPKTYIACQHDRTISYKIQMEMVCSIEVDAQITLDSSHSPFFSCPEKLSDILVQIAKK